MVYFPLVCFFIFFYFKSTTLKSPLLNIIFLPSMTVVIVYIVLFGTKKYQSLHLTMWKVHKILKVQASQLDEQNQTTSNHEEKSGKSHGNTQTETSLYHTIKQ